MSDYIDEFRNKKFCEHTRENFYKQARLDVARAKVSGLIKYYEEDIHDIINNKKQRYKYTDDEKNYIIKSPKTKEDLAVELDCTVFSVKKIRKQ